MYTLLNALSGKRQTSAFWSLLCLLLTTNAFAIDYYVALPPLGNNNNNGRSITSPFATIQQAANLAKPNDVVYVMKGTYREQVEIKNNGAKFRPYGDDLVTINGTDLVRNWNRMGVSNTYHTKAMNWDVDANWGTNQLFQDGRMIDLARWPKRDQSSSDLIMPPVAKAEAVTASGTFFIIRDDQFNEPGRRWVGAKIWVNLARAGNDGQGWTGTVNSIQGNTITVDFGSAPRLGNKPWGMGENMEYFLFDPTLEGVNAVPGGIDKVLGRGEWWKNENDLYVKTRTWQVPNNNPNPDGTGGIVIEAKRRHFAFIPSSQGNRSGYTIENFHLFACAITTDKDAFTTEKRVANRVIVEAAYDITLSGLTVKYPTHQTNMRGNWQDQHYNWTGIVLSGRNNTIKNCDISLSATSAVSFVGFGNKMFNNQIHDTNYMCSNAGAVNTGFVCEDAEIAYNRIWNTTMMAINFRYSKNSNPAVENVYRIHHNEIFDFMRRSGDSGAIDVFGQDLQWARIDHNRIYNTLDDAKMGYLKHGIYVDYGDTLADWRVRVNIDHNVIYEVNNPILINPGSDVNVFNNVLLSHLRGNSFHAKALIINIGSVEKVPTGGINNRVYNNITNTSLDIDRPNNRPSPLDVRNNLFDAKGGVLSELFVDAANHDYRLKSTATQAINKGIPVAEYMGDNYDEPVEGIPDIGAFEWGIGNSRNTELTLIDRTDPVGSGRITAKGQKDASEGGAMAFDNDPNTKWMDYNYNYSAGAWIQFRFGDNARYAISTYTITSANDVPERDPKNWVLYGTNAVNPGPNDYTELDRQSEVVFPDRHQKLSFSFNNTTEYSAYRLVITGNYGNGTPTAIQLAEIEFFGPSCAGCRTGAEVEIGSQTLALKVHPNPASNKVTFDLSDFAQESAVQVKISDMSGKLFVGEQVQLGEGARKVTLPVSHLPQGLFFVRVQGSKTAKTGKLIITK